ncbi:hypothetical protein [Flavobacterium sp. 2]|uniref:hypothetical protein n=1 Tax=Flavobacterium sp. 2 TaxID=308053 RepID=UPI000C17DDBA|nr:hypothetical protein [Flavobacterium sp. 2]PIF71161.1 hypothetical protein CLU99_1924 [Flavobacterium sp. 2]
MSLKEELRKIIIKKGFNESEKDINFLMQEIVRELYPVKENDVIIFTRIGIWDNYITEGKKYIVEKVQNDFLVIIDDSGNKHPYKISNCHVIQK